MAPEVHLIVYSDYLCPWCFNVSVRMRRLEEEYGDALRIEWRSFLLRPHPGRRDLEKFRAYTRSWHRPAADADAPRFQPWQGDAGPPSHSLPPQLAAKAAARLGPPAFRRLHDRLLAAYFQESRDISDDDVLRGLWGEVGLPGAAFEAVRDPALGAAVLAEHDEAVSCGASGVPAVRLAGNDTAIVGAHPLELYRRWVDRTRAAAGATAR